MESFTYTSLHQYLETVLKDVSNPTNAEVKQAKRTYWKLYYTYYRKEKRKIRKEFTLGFSMERLQEIHQKRGTQSVSEFLYQSIDKELQSENDFFYNTDVLSALHLQLMQLITLIEELLDTNENEDVTEVLERLEQVENSFSELIKT